MNTKKISSTVMIAVLGLLLLAPMGTSNASYIGTVLNTVRASTNKNTGVDRITKTYRELSVRNGYSWTTRVRADNTATEYATLTTYVYRVY